MKTFLSLILLAALLTPAPSQGAEGRGPLISLDLRDVELKDVLRALSQEHGINLVIDETITGRVTVSLTNIPLWDAIETILKSKGYYYKVLPGGLFLVEAMTPSTKQEEDLVIREFKLRYLSLAKDPKAVEEPLGKLLSERGKLISVPSTNSIVVKDLPLNVGRMGSLLESIDSKPSLVMIEARIVELSSSYKKDLGIQWGFRAQPDGRSLIEGATEEEGLLGNTFMVNLPAGAVTTTGAAAESPTGGISIGYALNRFSIDMKLSALEDTGRARLLSSPKIMVRENETAEIKSGTEIIVPVTTTTAAVGGTATTGVQTLTAALLLNVTPSVAGDLIYLDITTTRDEFDFSKSVLGIPPKFSRSAKTKLLVKDGETVVIGGILIQNESTLKKGVPALSKIPLLGWLFKKEKTTDDQIELLIFLTPSTAKAVTGASVN